MTDEYLNALRAALDPFARVYRVLKPLNLSYDSPMRNCMPSQWPTLEDCRRANAALALLPPSDPAMVQAPREPSQKMLLAACRLAAPESEDYPSPALKEALRKSYIAMIAAAERKV